MSITHINAAGAAAGRRAAATRHLPPFAGGRSAFAGRSLVGDIESEYDEYDRDADHESSKRRGGWLEPSW